jgi:hypothetical protein
MDLGFTTKGIHLADSGLLRTGECSFAPDWHELAIRMHAGWNARRALLANAGGPLLRSGHFDPESAEKLRGFNYASRAVNLTASANRKPAEAITLPVAGNSASGTRG